MENNENNIQEKNESPVRPSIRPLWLELVLSGSIVLFASLIVLVLYFTKAFGPIDETSAIFEFSYSEGKTIQAPYPFLYLSLVAGAGDVLMTIGLLLCIRPSGLKPNIGSKGKYAISLSILSLFGYLAYFVLALLLYGFFPKVGAVDLLLAGIATNVYEVLIYKLYMEERTLSNALFWEIFRFAIVGLVAAVFDFLTCFIVQFVFFRGNLAWYVTLVATACGFIIGVIINYLMSTYMVYKASKSGMAKTAKGMALFVILAVIGLGIGMGIQYLLYDLLFVKVGVSFFSYPIDFVIRTLIVMVYNYVSRKLLIYRK